MLQNIKCEREIKYMRANYEAKHTISRLVIGEALPANSEKFSVTKS